MYVSYIYVAPKGRDKVVREIDIARLMCVKHIILSARHTFLEFLSQQTEIKYDKFIANMYII